MQIRNWFVALLACGSLASCTVHHYHHYGRGGDSSPCDGEGHGMKGHGMKGHGMKGHGMKGHGMKGMKGHDMQGHGMKGHGMKDRGPMLPELEAVHDAFAAIWHTEPESARPAKACQAAPELGQKVAALRGATRPAKADPSAWDQSTSALEQKVSALADACTKKGDVAAALSEAHDAMHAVFQITGSH